LRPYICTHFTVEIEDRNHQRAHEVLVPRAFAEDAQFLQASTLLGAGGAVLVRQMVVQGAIGKAQPKVFDHFRRLQAALEQVLLGLGRLFKNVVVVAHHRAQQLLLVHRGMKQRRQLRHRTGFRRRLGAAGGGRKIVPLQQFQGVRKTDALGSHHPLDHVAAFPARALAVPDVFRQIDVEAGVGVFVEGAQTDQFLAAAPQLDALRLRQPLDRDFPLDPLLYLRGNVGHPVCLLHLVFRVSAKTLSRGK
jgi:hypothetical protein